ncbi:urease accessory protein UreD [Prochlorococcus sp. MIT 1341]|uniref:urease accessory protein UreD n=1 Tax=Prochlorococcus sp. MIT 1341 TaxID=3096221 RepID=UPI002A74FCC0|nr:urease accessory protein UreD [Prochlorococcus sp. MIT 1341]
MSQEDTAWHGMCDLNFLNRDDSKSSDPYTIHQGTYKAPFKLLRASQKADGRCELPILHTAGGLVGGDQLTLKVVANRRTRSLLTNVAAQKVYGSVGRLKDHPEGKWATQNCYFFLDEDSDLEWMPQEVIVFANGLFEQRMHVELSPSASFLGVEVVRLGRTSLGETLDSGCWRSGLEISRHFGQEKRWEFIDRLELSGDALTAKHGMDSQPVLGSLVWAAPTSLTQEKIDQLLEVCRKKGDVREGAMSLSSINHGISARYLGRSTQEARFSFFRIWMHIRKFRSLHSPESLRVWPMQEDPSF